MFQLRIIMIQYYDFKFLYYGIYALLISRPLKSRFEVFNR